MQLDGVRRHTRKLAVRAATIVVLSRVERDGTHGEQVDAWELGDIAPHDLAQEIWHAAQGDADEQGGITGRQFAVTAKNAAGDVVHKWRQRHMPESDDAAASDFDGPVSPHEQLSMQLRHNEKQFALVIGGAEAASKRLMAENERLQHRIEQLERREFQVMEMYRDLMTSADPGADERRERYERIFAIAQTIIPQVAIQLGLLPEPSPAAPE